MNLRSELDPDSQLLYDEVTTKWLVDPNGYAGKSREPVKQLVTSKLADQRFYAFMRAVQGGESTPLASLPKLLADPEIRLIAWQQVRQWRRDQESGAWQTREQTAAKRYSAMAIGARILIPLGAILVIYSLVTLEPGPVMWTGLGAVIAGNCLILSLPGGRLKFSLWQVHTKALASQKKQAKAQG